MNGIYNSTHLGEQVSRTEVSHPTHFSLVRIYGWSSYWGRQLRQILACLPVRPGATGSLPAIDPLSSRGICFQLKRVKRGERGEWGDGRLV
jgi:hypothetical protein